MEAWDALPDDHWTNANKGHLCFNSNPTSQGWYRVTSPLRLGNIDALNKTDGSFGQYKLKKCDEDTKRWKSFRDMDPSPLSWFITGTKSVALRGGLLEIDDEGNPTAIWRKECTHSKGYEI